MTTVKKTRLRFKIEDDILVLREVLEKNPYENEKRWKDICRIVQEGTKKEFTERAIREHAEHLIKLYRKEDIGNIRKSGTEEQFDEKERLLYEVTNLYLEYKPQNQGIMIKNIESLRNCTADISNGLPMEIKTITNMDPFRNSTAETSNPFMRLPIELKIIEDPLHSSPQNEILSPTSDSGHSGSSLLIPVTEKRSTKRPLQHNDLMYLNESDKANMDLKMKQLELEERKISLEEKRLKLEEEKFNLEKREREQRLEMEIKEREHQLRNYEKQQELINILLISRNSFNK